MNEVEEIKSRLNIVDIIGKHVKLKKAGRNFKGLCPFHNEKSPSFVVSAERQIFHCFGCGKGGTVFDFVMEYHHVDFPEALEDLATEAGVKLTRRSASSPDSGIKEKLFAVNHLASEFYHYMLTKHALGEKGLTYLKGRGISEKSMKTFMLGYSPNSWEGLYRYLRKKGYDDGIMEKAGLIIRSSHSVAGRANYYDRFRGRIMFTLRDHRGNVVGFAGRVLDPAAKEAKYINTSETPVYVKSNVLYGLEVTKDAIQKTGEAIIMEGELDVVSSFQAGIGNAVAIKGTALTEGHVRLLKRFTDRLVFALDSDMAGDAAARRGIEIADSQGFDMRVLALPSGKDPDEASRENPGLLKKAIKDAIPVYDYFLASAAQRFDVVTAYGKKKISEETLPVLAKIENPIVQHHYVKKLAQLIGSSEDVVAESLKRQGRGQQRPMTTAPIEQKTSAFTRPEKLEVYILALLLQGRTVDLFEELQENNLLPEFVHQTVHKIIDALLAYLTPPEDTPTTKKIFLIRDFADSLSPELIATLDEAFLLDIEDILADDELFAREWVAAVREFRKVVLRRKIYELTRQASDEEGGGNVQDVQKALARLSLELKSLEKSG